MFLFWIVSRHRHSPTVFMSASAFNADLSKWDTAAVTNMKFSTSTPLHWFFHSLCLSSTSVFLPIFFFLRSSSTFYFGLGPPRHWQYFDSVPFCICIQPGHFQLGHGAGDRHGIKYVHCTSLFCCPLLLSLEFSPLTPIAFIFTFSWCSFFWDCVDHHGIDNTSTVFQNAFAFNADLSKWNTAAVTTMASSTSTPPLLFCCPLLLSFEFHSTRLFFLLSFPQCSETVVSNEHCVAVLGINSHIQTVVLFTGTPIVHFTHLVSVKLSTVVAQPVVSCQHHQPIHKILIKVNVQFVRQVRVEQVGGLMMRPVVARQ